MKDSRTAYVILGLLSIEPNKSGYDLRKAIEGSVGHFWGESYGQIYPALKRLAADGLIVPSESAKGARKRRQEYSITEAGRACLREWLALPFHNDPPRNEFLLKLFFGGEAAPAVSIAHVKDCNDKNRRMLGLLSQFEEMARKQTQQDIHQPYWVLTLKLGIALTQAALDWGEKAVGTLSDLESAEVAQRE
jgi:DNA-binding PadR family transcriptional regulator